MSKTTVLVTGCFGYIGRKLIRLLRENNFYVIGVDNCRYGQDKAILSGLVHMESLIDEFYLMDVTNIIPSGMKFDHAPYVKDCDKPILNEYLNKKLQEYEIEAFYKLIDRADIIIPLAAIVGAPACELQPELAWKTNSEQISKIVKRIMGTKKLLIYPNTNSAYGTTRGDIACTEETPLNPISVYSESKCQGEELALLHDRSIVFRLATVHGVSPRLRLDLLVNDFTYKAFCQLYPNSPTDRIPPVIFEKDFRRNFVHINDVCEAFLFAIERQEKMWGEVYNLGHDDSNMSKDQLVDEINRVVELQYCDCFEVAFDDIHKDVDQRNYVVSNEKLARAGFSPSISIEYSIRELLDEFECWPEGRERDKLTSNMKNVNYV